MINCIMIKTRPEELNLKYGLLCLDFVNTVFWRLREEPIEGFTDYSILIKWGRIIGLITETDVTNLIQEAQKHPDEAELVLSRAINLRESLYRIIVTTLKGSHPDISDIEILSSEVSEMLKRIGLMHEDNKFEWKWNVGENELDQILWPILSSSSELLTSADMERIGICEGDGCGWLFFDQSRNRSRKWCDMGDCGNRAKARRFYKQKRENKE